jgi:hypothetical protein
MPHGGRRVGDYSRRWFLYRLQRSRHTQEPNLAQEQKSEKSEPQRDSNKHWILWTLLAIFVVGAIAVMMAADYLFAPALINPATLPEAVGK